MNSFPNNNAFPPTCYSYVPGNPNLPVQVNQPISILLPTNQPMPTNQPIFVQQPLMGANQPMQSFFTPLTPMQPLMNFCPPMSTMMAPPLNPPMAPQQPERRRRSLSSEDGYASMIYEKNELNYREVAHANAEMIRAFQNAPEYTGYVSQEQLDYTPPEDYRISNVEKVKNHGDKTEFIVTYNRGSSQTSSACSEAIASPNSRGRDRRERSVSREHVRRPSRVSKFRRRSRSNSSACSRRSETSGSSKRDLVPLVKNDIRQTFHFRYKGREGATKNENKEGMRGPRVVRIKCTTMKHLRNIKNFLVHVDDLIAQVSCPNSQKKDCDYAHGFQCYMRVHNMECLDVIQKRFEEFQSMNEKPFKKLEINPRSAQDKERERLSASSSQESASAIPFGKRMMLQQCVTQNCESPPEALPLSMPKTAASNV